MKQILFVFFVFLFSFNLKAQEPITTPANINATLPAATTVSPSAPVSILFLLDASGSMEALVGGVSQMEIAKKSLKETLASIPPTTPVALRVYAHRIDKNNKEASCQDTELLVPFETGNTSKISAAIDTIQPKGYTPIAFSLKAAAGDFRGKESQNVIVLVSDGEETCGGDPVAEAKNLLAQGFKVTIHTIGFRVDETTRHQLQAISGATGGSYFDASDAGSLTQNLQTITQKATFIEKPREIARGQEIRGGSQYQDAAPIQPGIEYRLDHHQKQNEYDYFSLPVKRGQNVKVTVTTQEKGVHFEGGTQGRENESPYAGFRLVDGEYKEITSTNIIGGKHAKEERSYAPTKDQTMYILIGSSYDNMHKDSPFKIEVSDHFDGGSQTDAGEDLMTALPIQAPGEYPQNFILFDYEKDCYKFNAKAGEAYTITITPQTMNYRPSLEIFDTNRVQLLRKSANNEGAILKVSSISVPEDGTITLEISGNAFQYPSPYSFSITKETVSPVAAQQTTPKKEIPITQSPKQKTEPEKNVPKKQTTESAPEKPLWILYGLLAVSFLANIGLLFLVIKLWLKTSAKKT